MSSESETEFFVKLCCLFSVIVGPFCVGGFVYTIFRDFNMGVLSLKDTSLFLEIFIVLVFMILGWTWAFRRCRQEYGWFVKK